MAPSSGNVRKHTGLLVYCFNLLQLGHLDAYETVIPDDIAAEEVANWYQGSGYPEAVEVLASFIQDHLMPDVEFVDVKGVSCVIAKVLCTVPRKKYQRAKS